MPQPICFIDNKYYDCGCYADIVRNLSLYPDICQIHQNRFKFNIVGVICIDGQPVVVFPKNYRSFSSEQELLADAKMLARVLLRYRNDGQHDPEEMKLLHGDSKMGSSMIAVAMYLLEDYCRNGYLKRQAVVSTTTGSGRIDWKSTINILTPILTNGNPLYPSPVMKRRKDNGQDIVVLAHKYVISKCFHDWGWLLGYDDVDTGNISLPCSAKEVIFALRKELRQTFQNREIRVIKHLIQYLLEETSGQDTSHIHIMATPYFSFVWEAVCGYLMDNQYPRLKSLLPQPVWESSVVSGHISQRPDIFRVYGKGLYILDAKYYDYTRNIPGWHDVVKQLFYRHTMKSIEHNREYMRMLPDAKEIYNGFLFPGSDGDCIYVGRVHIPSVSDLGEVKAFAINQKKALSAYAYRNSEDFLNCVRTVIQHAFISTG